MEQRDVLILRSEVRAKEFLERVIAVTNRNKSEVTLDTTMSDSICDDEFES